MSIVYSITNQLISGDACDPQGSDVIAQTGRLDCGNPAPDGWTVMDGNTTSSSVGRVAMRYQIDQGD